MTFPDFLGHVGYILIAAGMLAIGHGRPYGWVLRIVGELTWLLVGMMVGMSSIWFWGTIFIVLDLCMYYKWRKENHNEQQAADRES